MKARAPVDDWTSEPARGVADPRYRADWLRLSCGYQAAPDTLARIDRFLHWEPGSAELALKGGLPIRQGPELTPPPSLVPLNAVLDRQRRLLAQLTRYERGIAQMKAEVEDSINQVNLAIGDLEET
jgi:hypothetical protein